MTLTAIVPVWNGRDFFARLLATLDAQTQAATELLVIDNGSTDDAPELARQRGARVISMGRNAGFAAAVNRGIRECRTEWIAILNSDVELAPDYFARLVATGAPFATGKILSAAATSQIDGTFDAMCRGGVAWRVGQGRADGPVFSERRDIAAAPWTALICRAELFSRVGLLQENFESYLEDVEFGLRCAVRGVTGVYVPEAMAWHHGSATLGRWHADTVRRLSRNQCYLVALHYPPALLRRCAWPILVAQLLWGIVAARHGAAWAWICGKWEGLRRGPTLRRHSRFVEEKLLDDWLRENERNIHHIQHVTGFDPYWRLYFLLTSGGAK